MRCASSSSAVSRGYGSTRSSRSSPRKMLLVNDGLRSGFARWGWTRGVDEPGAEGVGVVVDAISKGIASDHFGYIVRAVKVDLFARNDARGWRAIAALAAAAAVATIVSTYHVFNNMF